MLHIIKHPAMTSTRNGIYLMPMQFEICSDLPREHIEARVLSLLSGTIFVTEYAAYAQETELRYIHGQEPVYMYQGRFRFQTDKQVIRVGHTQDPQHVSAVLCNMLQEFKCRVRYSPTKSCAVTVIDTSDVYMTFTLYETDEVAGQFHTMGVGTRTGALADQYLRNARQFVWQYIIENEPHHVAYQLGFGAALVDQAFYVGIDNKENNMSQDFEDMSQLNVRGTVTGRTSGTRENRSAAPSQETDMLVWGTVTHSTSSSAFESSSSSDSGSCGGDF